MKRLLILSLSLALTSCATISPQPTVTEQEQARTVAARVYREVQFGLTTIAGVRPLVNVLPLPVATKDDIGCAVVKAVGHTSNVSAADLAMAEKVCGGPLPLTQTAPLGIALNELQAVTTCASLGATVGRVQQFINPLLSKLDASTDAALRYAALAIRTGLSLTLAMRGASCV